MASEVPSLGLWFGFLHPRRNTCQTMEFYGPISSVGLGNPEMLLENEAGIIDFQLY